MDAAAYAAGISFRVWGPDSTLWLYWRGRGLLKRAGMSLQTLETLNTRLPEDGPAMRTRLVPLLDIPRMSTYAIGSIVNNAVRTMPPGTCFVNVGVWNGFTFLAGMAGNDDRRCIGVDNFSEFGGPEEAFRTRFEAARSPVHDFHAIDYRDYFNRVHAGEPIGFYLYDGDHAYAHQLEGLEAADPWIAPGGHILVDDTDWDDPRNATLDFVRARPGRYEVVFDRRAAAVSHPTFWNGVMIIRRTASATTQSQVQSTTRR